MLFFTINNANNINSNFIIIMTSNIISNNTSNVDVNKDSNSNSIINVIIASVKSTIAMEKI
ncbi:hypothetical protein EMQU_2927 (plasmid) [Enterococcus mundtii QU 25]|nr:hypothetical protein EMQU_2927 [Enterococcus mundtii QU 25]